MQLLWIYTWMPSDPDFKMEDLIMELLFDSRYGSKCEILK
jgi:hypothetical protein